MKVADGRVEAACEDGKTQSRRKASYGGARLQAGGAADGHRHGRQVR